MLVVPVVVALLVVGAVLVLRHRSSGEGAPADLVLRRTGFGIVAAWTLLGGAFVVGETATDPGGLAAVGLIAAWLVPLVVLAAMARLAPDLATRVLAAGVGVAVAAGLWFAVAPDAWREFEDDKGPVRTIATFVLGAALGVLGLARTRVAGALLLALGLVPPFLAQLGTSRGMPSLIAMATVPVVVGVLYLASGLVPRRAPVGYGPPR